MDFMRKYHNKTLLKQHLISQQLRINNYLKMAKNKSNPVNKLHQDNLIKEHEQDNNLEDSQLEDLYKKNIIVKGNSLIKGNVL